ncbi:serine hydrolase domain-containing protein [Devosia lacusdianchii]|uniref:serine hydrolase domain-containing protein n=1 Tax=Devosia lacusdianchii TaxID=2917991 RepID=UPI001F071097|nr:serine hydrolase [Devosia sp. JXJ CY 41]
MTPSFTRSDVTLANWRTLPYSQWAFHNASELVPSAIIASRRKAETPVRDLGSLASLHVRSLAGPMVALPEFLTETSTDAFVVMRDGLIEAEWYAAHYDPARPHLLFSITKSITGLIAEILAEQGRLSFDALVGDIMPDMIGSAYGDVSVRHLFDMQVSVEFTDDFLDTSGAFDRYRRAMLWNPEKPGDPAPDLRPFLATVRKAAHEHGTRHRYHSINTDLAGILLEVITGQRFADLVRDLIWLPIGAYSDAHITVDRAGTARAGGGMSATARDLARVGEMLRQGGKGIVPADRVAELWRGGDRAIWADGDQAYLFPGGSYRSYFYQDGAGILAGIGIHGQWLWMDPATKTVIVRLSAEPLPSDEALDQVLMEMLRSVSHA